MRRIAAPLAAFLCGVAIAACGDGAEPGAPQGASLILDFQPNAVHSGIYAAEAEGFFAEQGIDVEIREPSGSADGAKLLAAGRADFAILDINDLGIALERGLDVAAIAAVVQRPLASVIAADRERISSASDLRGATVGVTGVPSDDAVLDTVLAAGGVPRSEVERETIGFQSVPLLEAGRLDAATAFWNAEGVELRRRGVPIRELRVDALGAPRYPELVVATSASALEADPALACALADGLGRAYGLLGGEPEAGMAALLGAVPELEPEPTREQLIALYRARAFSADRGGAPSAALPAAAIEAWIEWAGEHAVIDPAASATVRGGFATDLRLRCRR